MATPGGPAQPMPPEAAKPDGEKKPEAEAKTDKPAEAPAVIQRPTKPEKPADPAELKVRPDADGKVRFNFHGQPWQDVLVWLADISAMSLDWQELPGDFLNVRTRRAYTVAEARDLINQHLLARGFTVLRNGEVLTVVNLKKLDPSLVPTVEPEELADRDPHEFVKVTFPLKWLIADKAVEEFKPLLSPNGKLTKLAATNRVQAMDAVSNLRDIWKVLQEEQSPKGQERLVRSFQLEHTRAADIRELLEELLGVKKGGQAPALTPEQIQQMQAQGQPVPQPGQPGAPGAPGGAGEVSFIVNTRENAIIAQAPPDKMAVIEQTVRMLDVESDRTNALLRNMNRMQVYRLAQLEPEPLVKVLRELGDFDPQTKLQVDEKNHSIIAYASLADHVTIRMLVEKLDGTDRKFEVVRLRRLPADFVAGTIRFMMAGDDKEEGQQNPYMGYYSPWGGYGMGGQQQKERSKFKVDADVENNRLLLYANEIELQEVQNLLVKLGEIPSRDGGGETVRVLDVTDEQAEELMRRLQQAWPDVRPNPLQVPPQRPQPRDVENDPVTQPSKGPGRPRDVEPTGVTSRRSTGPSRTRTPVVFTQLQSEDQSEAGDERAFPESAGEGQPPDPFARPGQQPQQRPGDERPLPPITIRRRPEGGLEVSSPDTQALNLFEDLAADLMPPRRDWHVFHLKHRSTWAWGVAKNLEKFFAVDEKTKDTMSYSPFWGMYPSKENDSGPSRLSRRRKLKFIPDSDSHTILVQGADAEQLAVIEELIQFYDKPDTQENASVRLTEIFYIEHSRAKVIAEAVKEVYRDLLSANDPALQQNQQQNGQQQPPPERSYTYIFGGAGEEGQTPEKPIKFKGLLSMGVDEVSNTLIVSAPSGLLREVGSLIKTLDRAAQSTAVVTLVPLNPSLDGDAIQKRLREVLGTKVQGPPPNGQPQPGQPNQGQPQGAVPNGGPAPGG